MNRMRSILLIVMLLACKRETAPPAAPPNSADQYQLLKEIEDALADRAKPAEVKKRWLGKRVTWEVLVLPPLCRSPAQCWVVPFDHAKSAEPIIQGWLPQLTFAGDAHAELIEACKAHDKCIAKIEGTMTHFELDPGTPTSVQLGEVRFHSARAARADESWGKTIKKPRNQAAPGPE